MWPFPDSRLAEREFKRIVIRVPNPLGDQVIATPALQAVRARYPDAHITLHGTAIAQQLYRGAPYFDDFLTSGRHEKSRVVARQLRAGNYDACLLLTGSLRTAVPPFLARIPHRIGYRRSGRTPLLTAHWPRARPGPGGTKAPYPTTRQYLDLVKKMGATEEGPLLLATAPEDERNVSDWLRRVGIDESAGVVCLCIGAAYGPSKIWPAEYFAAVADHVTTVHGYRAILLCGPGEEELGRRVAAAAKQPLVNTGENPISIDAVKALIGRARALVTNDTGPRHIATALGVPVVCLLGPMAALYTDSNAERQIVLQEPVACHPCEKPVCAVEGHPCLTRITPDRVFAALDRVWDTHW